MTKQTIKIQMNIIEPDVIEYITIEGDIKVSPVHEVSDIMHDYYKEQAHDMMEEIR